MPGTSPDWQARFKGSPGGPCRSEAAKSALWTREFPWPKLTVLLNFLWNHLWLVLILIEGMADPVQAWQLLILIEGMADPVQAWQLLILIEGMADPVQAWQLLILIEGMADPVQAWQLLMTPSRSRPCLALVISTRFAGSQFVLAYRPRHADERQFFRLLASGIRIGDEARCRSGERTSSSEAFEPPPARSGSGLPSPCGGSPLLGLMLSSRVPRSELHPDFRDTDGSSVAPDAMLRAACPAAFRLCMQDSTSAFGGQVPHSVAGVSNKVIGERMVLLAGQYRRL